MALSWNCSAGCYVLLLVLFTVPSFSFVVSWLEDATVPDMLAQSKPLLVPIVVMIVHVVQFRFERDACGRLCALVRYEDCGMVSTQARHCHYETSNSRHRLKKELESTPQAPSCGRRRTLRLVIRRLC